MVEFLLVYVVPQSFYCRTSDDLIARLLVAVLLNGLEIDFFVVAGALSIAEFVVEDNLAIYALVVPAERRRRELEDLPAAEAVAD